MTAYSAKDQIEKIDQQILHLLEERHHLYEDAREQEEDLPTDSEDQEVVEQWMEDATERGLDERFVEKICRLVLGLCKKGGEY